MSQQLLGMRVGIMGAGQLARMLAEEAHRLGLNAVVLASSSHDPAVQVCEKAMIGNPSQSETVLEFFRSVDQVIIENEFLPCELLKQVLGKEASKLVPSLSEIHRLSNKLEQKKLLQQLKISTAPFHFVENVSSAKELLASMRKKFPKECVLKWSRLGYDGHGVFVVSDWDGQQSPILKFIEQSIKNGGTIFAEAKISFLRELAMVACRAPKGEIAHYPLVESIQREGICFLVKGPVSSTLETRAKQSISKILEELNWVGTLAIEFFETQDGQLLVNELAPRVHNSGHYTQNASETSQFENHWRAVLGLPLGSTATSSAFVMLNLLGPADQPQRYAKFPSQLLEKSAHLHWYGKAEMKRGRKMGHVNLLGDDLKSLEDKAMRIEELWESENRK